MNPGFGSGKVGTAGRVRGFGMAKSRAALPTAGGELAGRAGVLRGTPEYVSPEQVRNPSAVDGRADLWAAGVIFYEMLTGRPPFRGANQVEVIGNVLHGVVPRASEAVPALPPAVDVLFARVFDRDLDSRFRTPLQPSLIHIRLCRRMKRCSTWCSQVPSNKNHTPRLIQKET